MRENGPLLVFGQTAMFFYLVRRFVFDVPAIYFGLHGVGTISATFGAVTAALGAIRRARAIATRPIARTRAVTGTIPSAVATIAGAVPNAIAAARTILSRAKHLLPVAAPEIHPVGGAGLQIVVAEALLNVGVVVPHALAMRSVVLPAIADVGGPVEVVDVEIAAAPVASAAPVTAPAANGPTRTEGETGGVLISDAAEPRDDQRIGRSASSCDECEVRGAVAQSAYVEGDGVARGGERDSMQFAERGLTQRPAT